MGRKKILTEEEQKEQEELQKKKRLDYEYNDLVNHHYIPLPSNPDRVYKIGDRVQWGAHLKSIVIEVSEDKRFYKLETTGVNIKYDKEIPYHQIDWQPWTNLLPYVSREDDSQIKILSENSNIFLRQFNTSLDSFYSYVYRFGVDFDVEYQRGYVWSLEDKENLIDSILHNIEIGKFLFIKRDWKETSEKKMVGYEILDGKQRLSTIIEFFESHFKYKGKYFHELAKIDQQRFTGFQVSCMEGENLSEQDRIKLFIRFNTSGKVMDKQHIENIKKLIK